ncbi:hypothetical protein [Streptomyces sp. TLI_171]|uniref:hypothetical protein n=1 Tax=Streptomyces sp. TLI_171 TaxID=1938859 RepID=UPI000C188419|nr:hypothetical protein [Streptomyces sp. TLI_171]RKE02913.1 hypothetical protein BX266_7516 [Streptomyces sp. TLI_171]
MGWEMRLSIWATVAAVLVAMWTLVFSSRALIRERRADFHLEQLAAIAVIVQTVTASGMPELAARSRMLPAEDFPLPVVRSLGEVAQARPERHAAIHRGWEARGAPQDRDELTRWLQEQSQAEVNRAVEHVLEMRSGWWEGTCQQFGFRGGVDR